jgi:hypothetical protein
MLCSWSTVPDPVLNLSQAIHGKDKAPARNFQILFPQSRSETYKNPLIRKTPIFPWLRGLIFNNSSHPIGWFRLSKLQAWKPNQRSCRPTSLTAKTWVKAFDKNCTQSFWDAAMSRLRGSFQNVQILLWIQGVGSRGVRYDEDRPQLYIIVVVGQLHESDDEGSTVSRLGSGLHQGNSVERKRVTNLFSIIIFIGRIWDN